MNVAKLLKSFFVCVQLKKKKKAKKSMVLLLLSTSLKSNLKGFFLEAPKTKGLYSKHL